MITLLTMLTITTAVFGSIGLLLWKLITITK